MNLQDMMDQFENGCKDQYKKETSQIHAPAGLIERTRLAVAEEERRLQAETKSVGKEQTWQDGQKRATDTDIERQSTKKPGGHHWNYDRVFRWTFSAAAAVILLFAVHRSAVLWGTGAGRTSKDSASGMAGAESYEEDGSMSGSEEEAADSSEAAAGGAETDMLAAEPDSEKYAEAEMEDHAIQQSAPAKTENSTSASEETAGDTDAERGVGADRIEELEKKYSEEDLASQISITEVDKKPDFYDRSDTDRVVCQGITFYVTECAAAEEEADKADEEKEEWSAYVEYNGKKYVITGQAADQDEFLEKAYENLIFF